LAGLLPSPDADRITASPDEFLRARTRRFGSANPERMAEPFWEGMIRSGVSAYEAAKRFGVEARRSGGPIFCAQRFGQSITCLPDGRVVQIGGEHEDCYDADFCIYNDVFVHAPDGSIAIYGYPESDFPPTDFHTATLVDGHIYVVGSLGYVGTRRHGETPVFRLDVRTLRIERVVATGDAPGWISRHRAVRVSPSEIRVWGGKRAAPKGDAEDYVDNGDSFVLDIKRRMWRRA
jgi:hypothetical protein